MRSNPIILLAFAASTFSLKAAAATFESGEVQTALLELYTSEGCSSCPPAEERLARLRADPALWKSFVPVAFHVDYWDRLGWPDRFALPAFTRRQYDYAAWWHVESVYTPAFVRNGREGYESAAKAPGKTGRLRVEAEPGGELTVVFQWSNPSPTKLVAEAAPLACGVTSDVRRGENAGRKLAHEFVALALIRTPLELRDGAWMAKLTLPAKTAAPISALAVWVHTVDDPTALQAVGGWLPK